MARKPIQHELVGMLTPRERLWRAIRTLRVFTVTGLQDATQPVVNLQTCMSYVRWLHKAQWLAVQDKAPADAAGSTKFRETRYALARDSFDAPRVSRAGGPVTQGLGTLAMWRAMKALGVFDYRDIQRSATVGDCVVKPETAKRYVNALAKAGYFRVMRAAKPGTPARYRLVRDTGAHAPAITSRKVVFDRNTGAFAELQTTQEVCDGLE